MLIQSSRHRLSALAFALAFSLLLTPVSAQEKQSDKKDVAQEEDGKKSDEKKADPKDTFEVPESGSLEELKEFRNNLKRRPARSLGQARKWFPAMIRVSSLIFEKEKDPKAAAAAADETLSALAVVTRIDRSYEGITAREFSKELLGDDRDEVRMVGKMFDLNLRAGRAARMTPETRQALIVEVFDVIKTAGLNRKTYRMVSGLARTLGRGAKTKDDAAAVYKRLIKVCAASDNKRFKKYAPKLEGSIRRMSLVGNPIDLKGDTTDGSEFSWARYKGKVVLVDFWATWCGPCVREVPNMKKNYKAYHARGFEIVGVNMDANRKAFDKFIAKHELPWDHIMGTKEANGWDHPMATYYGVDSIPTQILIGRDGNVIALNARGRALDRRLEQLLGPKEEKDEDSAADAKEEKKEIGGRD